MPTRPRLNTHEQPGCCSLERATSIALSSALDDTGTALSVAQALSQFVPALLELVSMLRVK